MSHEITIKPKGARKTKMNVLFNDAEGVRRTILDYSGDLMRMIDTALQGHTASTSPSSGNARKDIAS